MVHVPSGDFNNTMWYAAKEPWIVDFQVSESKQTLPSYSTKSSP